MSGDVRTLRCLRLASLVLLATLTASSCVGDNPVFTVDSGADSKGAGGAGAGGLGGATSGGAGGAGGTRPSGGVGGSAGASGAGGSAGAIGAGGAGSGGAVGGGAGGITGGGMGGDSGGRGGSSVTPDANGSVSDGPEGIGLVGHWSMEEGRGGVIKDSSGGGNNAMVAGGATWRAPGAPPSATSAACVSFNGATDVSIAPTGFPALGLPMTITFWIRPSSLGTGRRTALALLQDVQEPKAGIQIGQDGSRAGLWFFRSNTTEAFTDALVAGMWHHIGYTFDGTTHRLYLGTRPPVSATSPAPTGTPTAFRFAGYGSAVQQFIGELDEIRVYNRALSAAEISALARP